MEVSWKYPEPHNHNGIIRNFVVQIKDMENNETRLLNTTSIQLLVSDLHPYSTYYISVAAVTVAIGPYSNEISVNTLQDGKLHLCPQ